MRRSDFVSNDNRTGWSPIRSVIIRVLTKSDDRAAGVRFIYHTELDDTKSLSMPAEEVGHAPNCIMGQYYNIHQFTRSLIGNCRNVRVLGKSMVVFRLFEQLRYSNERSTKFESLYQE